MANGHGGPRTPANPAPVSGPGALSRRTDGQPARYVSGLPYGEGQAFMDLQTSAPMSATSPTQSSARGGARGGNAGDPGLTPLTAPTQRPDEPVTAGNPMGPGPGPLPVVQQQGSLTGILQRMAANDTTGDVQVLLALAEKYGW